MRLNDFLKLWTGVEKENKFLRLVTVAQSVGLVVVGVVAFSQDPVVVLQPYTLSQKAQVGRYSASQSYGEAWALYMAESLGNVTPEKAVFVKEKIGPLLDPSIHEPTIKILDRQVEQIIQDKVSLTFSPKKITYEKSTGKYFVYGRSRMTGPSGEPQTTERTYEFEIEVKDYAPNFLYLDTYAGDPRTEQEIEREERREQRKIEREQQR